MTCSFVIAAPAIRDPTAGLSPLVGPYEPFVRQAHRVVSANAAWSRQCLMATWGREPTGSVLSETPLDDRDPCQTRQTLSFRYEHPCCRHGQVPAGHSGQVDWYGRPGRYWFHSARVRLRPARRQAM